MYAPQPYNVMYINILSNRSYQDQQQIIAQFRNRYPNHVILIGAPPQNTLRTCSPQGIYSYHNSRHFIQQSPQRIVKTHPMYVNNRSPIKPTQQCQYPQTPQQPHYQQKQVRITPQKGNSTNVSPFKNSPNKIVQLDFQYQDGTKYKGQGRRPNIREGVGILFDKFDHKLYEGQWKDDKKNGNGVQVNFDADMNDARFNYTDFTKLNQRWQSYEGNNTFYLGEFSNDLWHGQGFLQLINGEKLVGTFKNGLIDGKAVFTTADPVFDIEGVWKNGIWQDI